jgi:phage gp29-like protein
MSLLDQYGREIKSNKPILEQVAVQTVRDRYSSYPSQGLTPERLATILKEADQGYVMRQAELFEEMEEKDCHLGAELQKRKLAVLGLEREILPASDSAEDKEIATRAAEMLDYIEDLDGGLLDIMDGVGKGFAVGELMFEMSEGQVWIKSIDWVHQKRFTFTGQINAGGTRDEGRGTTGFQPLLNVPRLLTDEAPVWGEDLLPNKFVFFRHRARSGATSRGGIMRPCAYMYLFKNYDIKDWLVFNDLFSVPMRVGKYKAGASPADIEALKQAVFNLGVDAAAVISDSTVIELLEAATRTNAGGFKELAEFCDKGMSKAVLGHSASAESTPGKLGNENQSGDIRQDLLEADAKALERTIRLQILGPWVAFNYGPDKAIPKVKIHAEEDEDLKSVAETYGALVSTMNFDGIPKSHVYERFGIPQPKDGEETIHPQQPVSPFGGFPTGDGRGTTDAGATATEEGQPPVGADGTAKKLQTTQASVLNGAQITAATAIVTAVAEGKIPRDAGIGQLKVLFNLTPEQAEQLMGSAGKPGTKTTPVENPAEASPSPPASGGPTAAATEARLKNKAEVKFHPDFQLMLNALEGADAAWVSEYMKRLSPALKGANEKALAEIEAWLASQAEPPSSPEFVAKIQELLGAAYKNMDKTAVNDAVNDMYRYYKNSLPLAGVTTAFGGADSRAVGFLSSVDSMFYAKGLDNPDAQAAVSKFLEEQYLKGGQGLFGRGDLAVTEEFQNLLSQQLGDTSTYQAQRIADTSVQRIRNFAHINKVADAGIAQIEIYEPTEQCPFCMAMNGRVIDVDTAYGLMEDLTSKTPEEYLSYLQEAQNKATLDNLATLQKSGALPPYHPNCHGRFIIKTKR